MTFLPPRLMRVLEWWSGRVGKRITLWPLHTKRRGSQSSFSEVIWLALGKRGSVLTESCDSGRGTFISMPWPDWKKARENSLPTNQPYLTVQYIHHATSRSDFSTTSIPTLMIKQWPPSQASCIILKVDWSCLLIRSRRCSQESAIVEGISWLEAMNF